MLEDNKDLPDAFLIEDVAETNGLMVFGTIDGPDFTKYKIGNEFNDDPHLMLTVMKKLFPSKIQKISHVNPCFYSMTPDDEFIFERRGNTVYGFGDNGRAFKHLPYLGKRIYHLITGNYKEADKYKKIEQPIIAKL
jgi:glycine/D-amino acid oxidase-like deaminating enzyme